MKVHLFPTVGTLNEDFRVPFQYQSPSAAEAKAFSLALLLSWIESNIELEFSVSATVTENYTLNVPAGKWAIASALQSDIVQTVNIGETSGGSELASLDLSAGGVHRATLFVFGGNSGTSIYFSGIGETVTITTLLI